MNPITYRTYHNLGLLFLAITLTACSGTLN